MMRRGALIVASIALSSCVTANKDNVPLDEARGDQADEAAASDLPALEADPTPNENDEPTMNPPFSPPPAQVIVTVFGGSLSGRPIETRSLGDPSLPAVLFLSTIHGNEWAGTPLLLKLEAHLLRRPELLRTHRAVLVPIVNPDGYAADRRTNDRGVDLNRNFPSDNFESSPGHGLAPLSEPESQALHQLIETLRPVRVISMHQPFGVMDFDGPAEDLAYRMAAVCDLPVERVGSRPGSLGSWVGLELEVPIITVEFHKNDHRLDPDELWERYSAMLLVCLRDDEVP